MEPPRRLAQAKPCPIQTLDSESVFRSRPRSIVAFPQETFLSAAETQCPVVPGERTNEQGSETEAENNIDQLPISD
jgi:hypothetical protein